MPPRLSKLRPLQLCILAGLVVFVFLTVFDNALYLLRPNPQDSSHIRRRDPQQQGIAVSGAQGPARASLSDGGAVAERTRLGLDPASQEKLSRIEDLLAKLNLKLEEKSKNPNISAVIHDDLKTVKELFRQVHGAENLGVVASEKFVMNGLLQEPKSAWPKPPKMQLNDMEFMKNPYYETPECPRTILKQTRYNKWFRERYIPDIKLFLEPSDVNDYETYYKLSHYTMPFGLTGAPRDKFGQFVNNANYTKAFPHPSAKRPKCLRCAVIGCGGVINGSTAGEEIDNHDYVFRLNHAYSSGDFAKDAGTKTSFYTFFPESQHIEDVADRNVSFFYTMFKEYDVDYGIDIMEDKDPPIYISKGKKYKLRKPAIANQRTRSIHPDFFRYIFTHYLDSKSHRPTTGALVVFLAIHMCDEVNIYGFGYDSRFTLHYYDKKFVAHTDKSTALHDVDNERILWEKLHEAGVIRLFKRDE